MLQRPEVGLPLTLRLVLLFSLKIGFTFKSLDWFYFKALRLAFLYLGLATVEFACEFNLLLDPVDNYPLTVGSKGV